MYFKETSTWLNQLCKKPLSSAAILIPFRPQALALALKNSAETQMQTASITRNDYKLAERYLREALDVVDGISDADEESSVGLRNDLLFQLAVCLERQARFDEARTTLGKCLALSSSRFTDRLKVIQRLAYVHVVMGDYEQASTQLYTLEELLSETDELPVVHRVKVSLI